jgi:Zn-dependent protease
MAITSLICALIHEFGHLVCIFIIGKTKLNLRGAINGFRIKSSGMYSYKEEMLIYLSGPIANITSFLICCIFSLVTTKNFILIGIVHLITAFSNLLPIKGYDGYGALRAIIGNREFSDKALYILSLISTSLIFSFCVLSLYIIDRLNGGYWIFAVFFVSMIKEFKEGLGE